MESVYGRAWCLSMPSLAGDSGMPVGQVALGAWRQLVLSGMRGRYRFGRGFEGLKRIQ